MNRPWPFLIRHGTASLSPTLMDLATTALFKLVCSHTIQHLESNPTHDVNDPGREEFQQTLDQLDRIPQEVITRSQQPTLTILSYGMVKAGGLLLIPQHDNRKGSAPC